MSFLFRNSVLLRVFLLWVEGLDLFFVLTRVDFTLLSLVSREKENVELMVREKLKSLPWLASAWQKARHCDAKEGSTALNKSAAIFTCSSEFGKLLDDNDACCFFTFINYMDGTNNNGIGK